MFQQMASSLSTKILLHDALAFDAPSSDYLVKIFSLFTCKTDRIADGFNQLIPTIECHWSVST